MDAVLADLPILVSITATIRAASREFPPSPKKSSWIPTRSSLNKLRQMPASITSAGVEGASYACAIAGRPTLGGGNARRSTLPLWVTGIVFKITPTAPCNRVASFAGGCGCC